VSDFKHSIILCDRGSLDGLAYWPGNDDEFFQAMDTTLADELARYDAVIFFESAAKSGESIKSNNHIRNESEKVAIILDDKLQTIWSQHPNFNLIQSAESFINKVMFSITTIEKIIEQYQKDSG
jgi:hypothetical protein